MLQQSVIVLLFLHLAQSEQCADNTCYGHGDCYKKNENEVVCICSEQHTGERCEYDKINCTISANGCVKGQCLKDHCVCQAEYAGLRCEYTDQCRENPCRDHGKCLSVGMQYKCLCDKGYTSSNCEKDIDECTQNPEICQNGGVCQNTAGSFQCQCPSGYDGQLCGYDIDDCDPDQCMNGGRCIDGVSNYRCECPSTFSGTNCEVEASDCGCEHGTCNADRRTCVCDLGWMGYMCNEKITSCENNPCQNGSHVDQVSYCKEYLYNKNQPKIHCVCATGLTGDYCEKEFNLCEQNPCRGQGDCTPGVGGTYICACYRGYTADNCETDIDECKTQQPCKNAGKCTNNIGSYYCECRPGFGGMNCEIDIDDCASEPCLHGGKCVDGEDSYTCICPAGYYNRSNCEVEVDECESNNCPEYSVCVDKLNYFRCICNRGSEDQPGCEIDENECTANLCKNGGTCTDLPGDFRCECPTGYSGKTCQFDNTGCGLKPCNHGTCYNPDPNNVAIYVCSCDPGYTGGNCEVDFDECLRDPCKNGAKCMDQVNDYFCDCPPAYTGKVCDLDTRNCANNPCENGGTCSPANTFPFYGCQCRPGYTGERCREERICEQNMCVNGGKCISLSDATWRCDCSLGYTGDQCEVQLDVCGTLQCHNKGLCVNNKCQCTPGYTGEECRDTTTSCIHKPCRNGATCTNNIMGFSCQCGVGYYGRYCENTSASLCASEPCRNGGTCVDGTTSYTCHCRAGYTGTQCEVADLCQPNPCKSGYVCENFPPDSPQHYMCCEESRAICYRSDGCPLMCEDSKNNSVCQGECYNSECQADMTDCAQVLNIETDPWEDCHNARCKYVFNNGQCNAECNSEACNYDGMDCREGDKEPCQYEEYCRLYYNNKYCDQGCNTTSCYWDGTDCLAQDVPEQVQDGIKLVVSVECEQIRRHSAELTYTLDRWTNSISVLESVEDESDTVNMCTLTVRFDNRYCTDSCITRDIETLKRFLWANLLSDTPVAPPFPFKVVSIEDATSSDTNTSNPETVSTAIIATITVIAILLLIVGGVVGRNVIRARARLWTPADFKTTRKRNIKDISTMGDAIHIKSIPNLGEQHKYGFYLQDQGHNPHMDVDMDQMFQHGTYQHSISKLSCKTYEDEETAPMITQAAYEFRQREETASPATQAEEQIAVGQRRTARPVVGRGETQLHVACRFKRIEELRHILSQGNVDINVSDSMGRTPLYAAVGADAIDIVDVLLEVDGIDVNKPMDQTRATPLILAAKMVYNICLEKLLKARVQVNVTDGNGRSALHWASAVNNIQAMELLIQQGANKDCQTTKLETPLFLAAREGKLEAVKMLVCHQAARHIVDSMEQTPMDVARDRLHTDIEEVLMNWGVEGAVKQHCHPGSLTPPQSDDAATGSPNSLPSPCSNEREDKKGNKRKKKKTEHTAQQQPMYQNGYSNWGGKSHINSPPWISTQMLSPESLQGSPTSTNIPKNLESGVPDPQQRLSHYPYPGFIDNNISPQGYIPHDQINMLSRKHIKPYNQLQQIEYHSSPDSPDEWALTSPPNSDWSHTSP